MAFTSLSDLSYCDRTWLLDVSQTNYQGNSWVPVGTFHRLLSHEIHLNQLSSNTFGLLIEESLNEMRGVLGQKVTSITLVLTIAYLNISRSNLTISCKLTTAEFYANLSKWYTRSSSAWQSCCLIPWNHITVWDSVTCCPAGHFSRSIKVEQFGLVPAWSPSSQHPMGGTFLTSKHKSSQFGHVT